MFTDSFIQSRCALFFSIIFNLFFADFHFKCSQGTFRIILLVGAPPLAAATTTTTNNVVNGLGHEQKQLEN